MLIVVAVCVAVILAVVGVGVVGTLVRTRHDAELLLLLLLIVYPTISNRTFSANQCILTGSRGTACRIHGRSQSNAYPPRPLTEEVDAALDNDFISACDEGIHKPFRPRSIRVFVHTIQESLDDAECDESSNINISELARV